VDNRSTDQTAALVQRCGATFPRLRLVAAPDRMSRSYACNVGARAAHGDVFLFCDSDDLLSEGWLPAFAEVLAEPTAPEDDARSEGIPALISFPSAAGSTPPFKSLRSVSVQSSASAGGLSLERSSGGSSRGGADSPGASPASELGGGGAARRAGGWDLAAAGLSLGRQLREKKVFLSGL
jgi:glycosyltransferase involved in cell wall biosynthesis